MAKFRISKPKGKREDETVAEWYERVTQGANIQSVQRLGSLQDQSTANINGTPRASNE